MKQVWIPERKMKQIYAGRISTVSFNDDYLAALDYSVAPSKATHRSFWALGGDFELTPEELERKVIDAYLSRFGGFQDLALRFYMAGKEPLVLENESDGRLIPFKHIVGLAHTYGLGYSDLHDLMQLEAVASAVPEIESNVYFANFIPLEPSAIPESKSLQYTGSVVGNLRKPIFDRRGKANFLRVCLTPNTA